MILLPDGNIRVLQPIPELNYFDSQSVELPRKASPLEAWNVIMDNPQPLLKTAFRARDAVSSLFGVRRIGGFSGQHKHTVKAGEHLDFFVVEHADEDSLVLTDRDRHLDVMTCISTEGRRVFVTSSVRVHNWFGHVYMIPVGIAHRWIVRNSLRRLQKKMAG